MRVSLRAPRERIVITGLGVIAPNGIGLDAFWEALVEGRSGIDWITSFDTSKLYCKIGGEIRGFDAADYRPAERAAKSGRFSNFAVAAARLAVADADLDLGRYDPYDLGAAFGTTMAGVGSVSDDLYAQLHQNGFSTESIDPVAPSETSAHAATSNVFIELGLKGPNTTSAAGCASALDAISTSAGLLRAGQAKIMIAGGTEALLSQVGMTVLAAQRIFTSQNDPPDQACKPYDKRRDGLVLSEGSAAVVMETAEHAMDRGARIYGEVVGYGATTEAYHLLRARPSGGELAHALRRALLQAKVSAEDIDYICAHGIGNKQYDVAETNAVKAVLGARAYHVPMSSIKSMTGQPFAAGGGWQVATACMAMQTGLIPPTINLQVPDPDCDLDYVPRVARQARVNMAMMNSHSVGGTHACMLIRRFSWP